MDTRDLEEVGFFSIDPFRCSKDSHFACLFLSVDEAGGYKAFARTHPNTCDMCEIVCGQLVNIIIREKASFLSQKGRLRAAKWHLVILKSKETGLRDGILKSKGMMNQQGKIDIFMHLEIVSQWFFPVESSALCIFSHGFMTKLCTDNVEHFILLFLVQIHLAAQTD